MSVPNTMRVGPFLPTVLVRKRYLIFYIIIIWATIIPLLLIFWAYWQWLWNDIRPVHFYTFLPLLCFVMYVVAVLSAVFFAKIILVFVNAIHKPREGTFLRHDSDKDYRYWSMRSTIKRFPFWLAHKFPFPFLDNICFKVFGVKTKFSNSLFEGWCDTEFLEFGKNVVVGQGAIIQSSVIIGNLLIIRKTVIEDEVRIGSHAIVMPGTHIGTRSVLAANSVTTVGQELKDGWIYVGIPAKEFKRNWFFEDGLQDKIGQVESVEKLRARYEKMYIKRYDEHHTRKERKELKEKLREEEIKRFEEEYDDFEDGFNI
jgi:carbonic anhydrase/acetyltransferase-like protein (isoleucine patch superfamily)